MPESIKTPIVPGGTTDSPIGTPTAKTAEQIAADAEAKRVADEKAKTEAEVEAKRLADEEAAKANANPSAESDVSVNKIILTTDNGDVEYDLNADGDAVKDGKVVYTAAQLKEFEDAANATPELTVADIATVSGINPTNADGTPKEYDLSVEGLAQREADIFEMAKRQARDEAVSEFFKMNPDIYQATLYKQTYGSLEGFANHTDWTTMTLEGKSDDQLESIIRAAEKRKGTSDAQIERIIRFSKADKVLNEAANESLDYLAKAQKFEIAEATKRQEVEELKAQEALDTAYGITYDENGKAKVLNVKGSLYDKIVNEGVLGGLSIPTAGVKTKVNGKDATLSRKDLVRYLTEPTIESNGAYYTAAQKAVFDMLSDNETFAMIAIRNLLGEDINQLAAATIRQATVRKLNIASGNKPTIKGSTGSATTKINPNRRPVVPGGVIDSK